MLFFPFSHFLYIILFCILFCTVSFYALVWHDKLKFRLRSTEVYQSLPDTFLCLPKFFSP